ncbi:hypothetical protein, partial [Candidatus Methylacidithermus pantelleriae]|uniref:hypothetical protein n=1 Tax=Candidatus Methylacidithermus pantelleriae TaxID=2744239 RepID=UPI001BD5AECC
MLPIASPHHLTMRRSHGSARVPVPKRQIAGSQRIWAKLSSSRQKSMTPLQEAFNGIGRRLVLAR